MAKNPESTSQDIEQLRQRHLDLTHQRIEAETQLKSATETMDRLKAEAREKYGTDDLDELGEKLKAMKAENEAKRLEYQRSLDGIEKQLGEIERGQSAEPTEGDSP